MSDSGFRQRLHELGIGEEEVEDILTELNGGQPLSVNVRNDRTETGQSLHRRTPLQAMYHLKERMEEERGLEEHEAIDKTFDVLWELKTLRDSEGVDSFRSKIGLMSTDQLQDFTAKVQSGEYNRSDNLYEYRQASKTVLDAINEKFVGLSHDIEHKREHQRESNYLQDMIDTTLKSFQRDRDKRHAKMDAQIEIDKIRVEGLQVRAGVRIQHRENLEKMMKKGAEMTAALDRITEKVPPKLQNRIQAKKVEKFWRSEEGRLRRDNMVMQAALISLHTRNILEGKNRKKVTNQDLQIGKKIFAEHAKKGTLSKSKAFTDIHVARHLAAEGVAKKRGTTRKEMGTPSLKRIYASIYGTNMTAEQVTKNISLEESNLVFDPNLRRDLRKKMAALSSRPDQSPGNVKNLKVTSEGVQKLRSKLHKKAEKIRFEKVTEPSNQEMRDERNAKLKKLNDAINDIGHDPKKKFYEKVIERTEKIAEAREDAAKKEKRKEQALEKKAAEEERLKKEMGPEAYEKMRKEREDESLKQEQNQQQKKDSDDLW